ncbi:MAG: hypothetical protein AB1489_17960 [Acidobacteriota bacterium]
MLVSLSVLMLELILTRIFSVTMYYHFAFLAISLALFGSGASGIYIYLLPRVFQRQRASQQLALAAMLCAISLVVALVVLFRSDLNLTNFQGNYLRLLLVYIFASCPFFLGGLCISLALTHYADTVSRLYFYDLIGASLGCLLVIPALNLLGGPTAMLAISLPLLLAAIFFSRLGASHLTAPALVLLMIALGLVCYDYSTQAFAITNAKGDVGKIIFQKWNSFSRVTVSGDPEKDSYLQIKIDSDAATSVSRFNGDVTIHRDTRHSINSLAYHLKENRQPSVLIIGPGGGPDVLNALVFDASKVTGVEINPLIANDIMRNRFGEYSGNLYKHPKVNVVVDEGRSYIRSTPDQYDIIQATLVDTWAATSAGAFALTENNLYTVEAFKDYVTHLAPDGVLTMTRWLLEPPQQELRLISLTRAMMAELGIPDPEKHIMIVKDRGESDRLAVTFIFKRTPFQPDEVEKIHTLCQQEGFGPLYLPGYPQENIFTKLILAPNPEEVYRSYSLNIEPTYDNSPFFFNNVRMSDYRRAFSLNYESQKTNLGMFVLVVLFLITMALVVAFLLGPLVIFRRDVLRTARHTRLRLICYFACLGMGFITVEIALVQKFTLFLGHPVYALAVILFSLLLFSSLGSYLTGRFSSDNLVRRVRHIIALLAVIVLLYIAVLPFFFYNYVSLALPIKIGMAVLFLMPLALVMGMPMPIGIKLAHREEVALVPWAWGVNGATSVLGSVTTFILAISFGFNQALLVGLTVYALAALLVTKRPD